MSALGALRSWVPFQNRLRWLWHQVVPARTDVLALPYCGSLRLQTRIVLHPGEFFTRPQHRLVYQWLKRPIDLPVRIRANTGLARPVESRLRLVPGHPMVLDCRSMLRERQLAEDADYVFEVPVEFNQPLPLIEIQMKEFESRVWGSFIIHWINFKMRDVKFVMFSPKFRLSEQEESRALLAYSSTDPAMPPRNAIRYILCDETGRVVVNGRCVVERGSFVILPTREELQSLHGHYTMMARAEQALASITLNHHRASRVVTLEHTQPMGKYHRLMAAERRVTDLKAYWYQRLEAVAPPADRLEAVAR